MANVLELTENGRVLATTTFYINDIKKVVWLDKLGKEIKSGEENANAAFYGEELKLQIEIDGKEEGAEFEIEIKAKDAADADTLLIADERQPLTLTATLKDKKIIFDSVYLNPMWFDKENPLTYVVFLKIKGSATYIAENLPNNDESRPKPIGFGKPDIFKIDAKKGYLLERQENDKKVAYVSGDRLDIEMYQDWFENGADELDYHKKKAQVQSYFKSVYGVRPYGWAPNGEFGRDEVKIRKVVDLFEQQGAKHKIDPSILWTIAVGEGLITIYKDMKNDFNIPVNSFQAFGIDFLGDEEYLRKMYNGGYLKESYKSAGIAKTGLKPIFYKDVFPQSGSFVNILEFNGSIPIRNEAGGPKKIYPIWFKNMEQAVVGCTAVYARSYDLATKEASSLGWESLNLNQNVYYAYYKVQYPYRKLTYYDNNSENFHNGSVDESFHVPIKAYNRWVTWRYVMLSNYFSK